MNRTIDVVLCILAIVCNLTRPILSQSTSLRKLSLNNKREELRILTFGTSLTWGSTLKDRFKAYPYLLSANVTNVAMRASDSSYPSMCTQSMVEDSIYDVIIIEYDRRRFNYLLNLVRRLRTRFPDSTIILTKMWSLMDVTVTAKGGNPGKLRDWLGKSGHPTFSDASINHVLNQDVDMNWDKVVNIREPYMKQAEEKYNVIIYSWPLHGVVKSIVKSRFKLFEDYVHLNEYGHSVVATELSTLISEAQAKRSDRLGSWGDGDICYSWFHNGLIDNGKHIRFNNIPMNKFDPNNGKFALEFSKDRTVFHVNNPFDGPRNLYLTYMASYPNRLYPKVIVSCNTRGVSTIIDPMAKYDFDVHVQDTKAVCTVRPGRNVVSIESIQEDDGTISAEAPFRLVGIVVTNEDYNPSSMYFKPLET